MTSPDTIEELATTVRPLLRELGVAFSLPRGVLGVALRVKNDTVVIIAEFIGIEHSEYYSNSASIRSATYVFDAGVQLCQTLMQPGDNDGYYPMAADPDLRQAIGGPLRHMLPLAAPPDRIVISRHWLMAGKSVLYHIAADAA